MKVIIIGGVAAGMSAASKLVRTKPDAQITVYEKGGFLSYGACGLPYYVGGYNDDYKRMIARTKEQFEAGGIKCNLYHEVLSVDEHTHTVQVKDLNTGKEFTDSYDKLMISVGASAIMPPFEGAELLGVHPLKTLEEGIFLKEYAKLDMVKRVTIVGGGYIGVECAEAFLHQKKEVRLIEASDRLLTPFDPEISALAFAQLEEKGVKIHLSEKVKAFQGEDVVRKIITDQGVYDTELVIVAVGVKPATAFLNHTGIKMSQKGAILVNRKLETSVPDIYAAGDCVLVYNECLEEDSYLALGTVANKCGRIAGANMAGASEEFIGALGSAAIKVCDLEMARTGMGEAEAVKKQIPYKTVVVTASDHPAYYPDPTPITIKLIYDPVTGRILGAQTCGQKGAVLRTNIFAVAIHGKMTVKELGMTDLIYAPPFAGVWDAVHIACNAAK